MWIYIVDMHFHILADVFFFDNMNYSSKLFNPTSFVIEPNFSRPCKHIDSFVKIEHAPNEQFWNVPFS